MKKEVRIGCSAYNNRYWKGVFYPEGLPATKWFDYYCKHFDNYEMNGTFYRFPTLKTMENWYGKAPEGFLFSVKAPKEITHIRKMIGCSDRIAEFYETCSKGLREKLGYVLFQFPPGYDFSEEKLNHVIAAIDKNFKNVVEFRHVTWWNPQVWETLSANNIVFCSVSYPNLPETIFTDFPSVYVRLHGVPKLFYSVYGPLKLKQLKDAISNDTAKDVTVFFNNTASTAGIEDALEFKKML